MRKLSLVNAFFLAVVVVLSATCVQADTFTFPAPLYKGDVFVVVTQERALSPVTVKTVWGPWSRQEDLPVIPPRRGIVIKLKNGGSAHQTQLTITATNGIVAKVDQKAEGQAIEEWNSILYNSVSW